MASNVMAKNQAENSTIRRIKLINEYLGRNPIPWDHIKAELGAAYVGCCSVPGIQLIGNDRDYMAKSDTMGMSTGL